MDMSKVSKVDELSIRKVYVEKMISGCKKSLEDKVFLMLGETIDKTIEIKAQGQIVFLERWIKDIDKEIENLK